MPIIRYIGTGCFWIFTSESLVLVGNGAGYGVIQSAVLTLLLAPVFLYPILAGRDAVRIHNNPNDIATSPGTVLMVVIGFAGVIGTSLFISTGILVSAGFTFNEVFFYRFPNFGFAFLLLASAVALNALSEEKRELIVGVLVSGAIGCILVLVLLGICFLPQVPVEDGGRPEAGGTIKLFWPLFFLYLGFEQMAVNTMRKQKRRAISLFLVSGVVLLLAWGYVSSVLVSPGRLSESTIPHMLAAGKIAPPWGRYLMGVAIICSGLAVVIKFFSISKEFLLSAGLLPSAPGLRRAVPLLLGLLITLIMFAGVAGEERLETMIRTSLLLWMTYGGATVFRMGKAAEVKGRSAHLMFLSGGIILAACLVVFLFQGEFGLNLNYIALFLLGSAICVTVLKATRKHLNRNYISGGR